MELQVFRDTFTENSTTGKLSIDGVFFAFTLEPRSDQSQGKPYCIPEGRYQVLLLPSPRFGRITPHLQNVPGFTEIEIHMGNDSRDTDGCLLVGETRSVDFIGLSDVTFNALMAKLTPVTEEIWITYQNVQIATDVEID